MENTKFVISSSPHIRSKESTSKIMKDVLIALLPAAAAGVYYFRIPALINIIVAVVGAVGAEFVMQKLLKKKVTIGDCSAAVTGLLLAMNIPATLPWWITLIGSIFAIAVVKQLFGGLGHNFMNPALAARAMLLASWPVEMTSWIKTGADAVATATPLASLKDASINKIGLVDLFIGNCGGCIGETAGILLILGGVYLIFRGVISYRIPVFYVGTVAILTFIFSGLNISDVLYNLFAGGLLLGAFFMATDYSSSPALKNAQIVYAIGCGVLTSVIRYYGGYPEGVSYSILLMNVVAPILDKFMVPRVFGEVKK
ncbi:MAG: RnfABCDGE type electron transport complex subunit D [Filifactoraceae bacterium]